MRWNLLTWIKSELVLQTEQRSDLWFTENDSLCLHSLRPTDRLMPRTVSEHRLWAAWRKTPSNDGAPSSVSQKPPHTNTLNVRDSVHIAALTSSSVSHLLMSSVDWLSFSSSPFKRQKRRNQFNTWRKQKKLPLGWHRYKKKKKKNLVKINKRVEIFNYLEESN